MVQENRLSEAIIGAAIEVHRHLGPGLLESAYEACLCRELSMRAVPFVRQRELPLDCKGVQVDCGFPLDLVVADLPIVEVKAVGELLPIHKAQLLTYLRLTGLRLGLLLNFNVTALKRGIARVALGLPGNPSAPSASSSERRMQDPAVPRRFRGRALPRVGLLGSASSAFRFSHRTHYRSPAPHPLQQPDPPRVDQLGADRGSRGNLSPCPHWLRRRPLGPALRE